MDKTRTLIAIISSIHNLLANMLNFKTTFQLFILKLPEEKLSAAGLYYHLQNMHLFMYYKY